MSGLGRAEARRVVDEALARFVAFSGEERVRLYRLHLQATVTRASPLAIDLAALSGVTLPTVAAMLPIPRDWPKTPGAGAWKRFLATGALPRGSIGSSDRAEPRPSPTTRMRIGRTGVAVRGDDDPRGDLGFVPKGDCLEAVSRVGDTTLHTHRGSGLVVMAITLPETALAAMRGRPVETIVSHAALDARGYLIQDAFNDEFMEGSVLRFGTGLVGIELPWAPELAHEAVSRPDHCAGLFAHASTDLVAEWRAAGGWRPNNADTETRSAAADHEGAGPPVTTSRGRART